MNDDFIRVSKRRDNMWAVLRGSRHLSLIAFAIKSHAVAYGRSITCSGRLAFYVDDQHGLPVRQSHAGAAYRVRLN